VASIFWKPAGEAIAKKNSPGASRRGETFQPSADHVDSPDLVAVVDNNDQWKNGTLSGKVTNTRDGSPAEGVVVEVIHMMEPVKPASGDEDDEDKGFRVVSRSRLRSMRTTTDASGKYTLQIPPSHGMVWLQFSGGRYVVQTQSVAFDKEQTLDLALDMRPVVTITAKNPDGTLPPKINVRGEKTGFLGITTSSTYLTGANNPAEVQLAEGMWTVKVFGGSRVGTVAIDMKNADQAVTVELKDAEKR
jgi:hypothetical protein